MRPVAAIFFALAAAATAGASDAWFDTVERALTVSALQDQFRARLSGTLTAEAYAIEQPPPGLVFTERRKLFVPRATLFLDGQLGDHLAGFVQARVDRGFDPNTNRLNLRLDEWALRFKPWNDRAVNFQLGQFATVIGNWVARHDPRDNPFITAPLPYEHLTVIYGGEASASPKEFLSFKDSEKIDYNPIIWGPNYATGAAVNARSGRFDFAAEIKNVGPSSRPDAWSITRTGFEHPAVSARVGFRPDLRWSFGFSASDGAYFLPRAGPTLPTGRRIGDFHERLFAHDLRFAWRHLQVWAEIFHARFAVPLVGDVRTIAGYVEVKYKFTPRVYGALRWNRQGFSQTSDGVGHRVPWGHDLTRLDLGAGYRFTSRIDFKVQASGQRESTRPEKREQLNYAAQFNVRF